ncbi:MAG TPA: glycosyltransferase family 2 protein [Thermoleophilaceae bacterium]
MTAAPSVSLLMPVYNREHLLDRVLEKLCENTTYPEVELVAVNDGSTDRSGEILRRWRDSGRFPGAFNLIEKPNSGAIDSLNTALNAATGELCVQLDDDVTVETPGWIERMVDLITLDESVGVVTGKVVMDSGYLHACGVNVVGPLGWHDRPSRPLEKTGRRLWLTRAEHPKEGQGGDAEARVAEVDSGIGCCMMYRREEALAVGGYDLAYAPVWFDDVDLCLSIRKLGKKVFYLPDVRVIHYFVARRRSERWYARFHPRRIAKAIVRRTGGRLPLGMRAAIERRVRVDLDMHFTRPQVLLLGRHHAYWREKWGWDARNPDMDEVQRRWGGTEICWATDPERRAAGERIAREYEARRRQPAVPGV